MESVKKSGWLPATYDTVWRIKGHFGYAHLPWSRGPGGLTTDFLTLSDYTRMSPTYRLEFDPRNLLLPIR